MKTPIYAKIILYFYGFVLLVLIANTLTGCSGNFGAGELLTETEKVDAEIILLDSEKIERISEYEKEGIKYKKHRYKSPDGTEGTQIIYSSDIKDCSIGYGSEAAHRTWCFDRNFKATTTK